MEPIYVEHFKVEDAWVDRFARMKPSTILYLAQEMGGRHSSLISLDYEALQRRKLFWAVTRHRVEISRMPRLGETLRVETWPLPPTRAAYPRSVIGYDESGEECFRVMTLWVLMDTDTRHMILPGKSGIAVPGTVRGNELATPNGLVPRPEGNRFQRTVCYTDLDRNGHMNNTRVLDWFSDMLPSTFHADHIPSEFLVCYLAEGKEGQTMDLNWERMDENCIQLDARDSADEHRVFSARVYFEQPHIGE